MRLLVLKGCVIIFAFLVLSSHGYSQESLFPQIPGWNITQDDPVYTSNNLWDIIDGAADLYLEYAFVDLHIARYINSDSLEVKAELYRHGSDADAFGMYSQERDSGYNFIQLGVQGYLQQGVLNFLTGSYYIKLSTYQTGSKAQDAMLMIGRKLVEQLRQNNSMPKHFMIFPGKGRLRNSEQYVARNYLGYSFLNAAYVVSYRESSPFKVFTIESATKDKAQEMIGAYLHAVPKDSVTTLGSNTYEIHDPHSGLIGLQLVDRYIFGVVNYADMKTRDQCLKELATTISKNTLE
jgi:hypothetical protein